MLNKMIPSEQRATLISINSMFFSIGMIIIFPIAGLLADYFGLGRIFAGISVILVLFVLILEKDWVRQENKPFATNFNKKTNKC